jgi:S1-C subfamily serine protease
MVTLTPSVRKEINQEDQFDFQVEAEKGVIVVEVIDDSPADRAGFKQGDIIMKVGGKPIRTAVEVQQAVEMSQIGAELAVIVNRNGNRETITVRPGEFPLDDYN